MGRKRMFDEDTILAIRSSEESLQDLAEKYGTTPATIHNVRNAKGAYTPKPNGKHSEDLTPPWDTTPTPQV